MVYLTRIPFKYLTGYFGKTTSLFRLYQNNLLALVGPKFRGHVIELGGESKYNHKKYFFNASSFLVSNIARDCDMYIDARNMSLDDEGVDNFIMVSALQHIPDFQLVLSEIRRKLRSGGMLLLVNAFGHPYCDERDYYRFGKDAYHYFFEDGFEILEVYHLGGKFSVIANTLQRPIGRLAPRFLLLKVLGFLIGLVGYWVERPDSFPLGVGILVRKK